MEPVSESTFLKSKYWLSLSVCMILIFILEFIKKKKSSQHNPGKRKILFFFA